MPMQFGRYLALSLLGSLSVIACGDAHHSASPADPPVDESHCLRLAEETLDFGPVTAACGDRERAVTVLNRCSIPVAFSASLSSAPTPAFAVIMSPKSEVPAHGWSQFQVRFIPSAPGTFSGTVAVHHAEQELSVSIAGQSVDGTKPFAEEWRTPDRTYAIDVLFVIDNSSAMAGREDSLKRNFAVALRELQRPGYDFHIAVTTTDSSATGEQGRFLPLDDSEPRVLTTETPDLESLFARRVQVGTGDAADTAGLEAARRALSPALLASHNGGFLRDDAFLSIIVVSASSDNSPDSFNAYASALLNVKGFHRSHEMSFASVVRNIDLQTDRYARMSSASGGIRTFIESSSWGSDLFRVSDSGFVIPIPYRLSAIPADPSAIRVLLDGFELPSQPESIRSWEYNPERNSVDLEPVAQPAPGELLRIEYPVGCTASE